MNVRSQREKKGHAWRAVAAFSSRGWCLDTPPEMEPRVRFRVSTKPGEVQYRVFQRE